MLTDTAIAYHENNVQDRRQLCWPPAEEVSQNNHLLESELLVLYT
jgi:hypothetical protein